MRSLLLALAGAAALTACSFDATGNVSASPSNPGDDTSTGAADSTTGTVPPPTSTTADGVCAPGASAACDCPSGQGTHTCNDDGQAYGPCDCPEDPTTSTTTPVDPSTTSTTDTTAPVDPSTTTTGDDSTSTTSDDTTTTSDDTTTTNDDTTTTGDDTTGDPPCVQKDTEPNNNYMSSIDHGEEMCNAQPKMLAGTLDGDMDSDWHKYHSIYPDMPCGNGGNDPTFDFKFTAPPGVRLCVYFACDEGADDNEDLDCYDGSVKDDDLHSCCGTANFKVDLNCSNQPNESSMIYLQLSNGPADMCSDYTVTYDTI